ncbi:MAG TPA: hypothetical protein VF834_20045 [Streptosporangiaceae bacterium]
MLPVYVVLLLAAVAILGGVVVVAMGLGGELALSRRDLPPLSLRLATAADVARLRLPIGLLGYQEQATADTLRMLARLIENRDAEIARLRAQASAAADSAAADASAGHAVVEAAAADAQAAPQS